MPSTAPLARRTLRAARPAAAAPGARVAAMFALIDARDWDALADVFHQEVEYLRPGYPPIRGMADLLDFYRHRRIIACGRHALELVCASPDGRAVSATGGFSGTDRQGRPLAVRFCDVYRFDEAGRILRRETFFNAPAV